MKFRKKIIFRADGNSKSGLGHLYRLFSLVEIVKDEFEFIFLTHETSLETIIPFSNKKVVPKSIGIVDEPEWLSSNFSPTEYIIIADGYHFVSSYQRQLKEFGYNLLYIDDLTKEHMYANIVINHSPNVKEENYSKEFNTILALGTKYALLRPLFLKEAEFNRQIDLIDTAFVCFGGADPMNLTIKAVKALLGFTDFERINVILGGAYVGSEIFSLEDSNKGKIDIHRNLSEEKMIGIMKQSNFGIVPASTILYELCCVKMPVLCGFYVDNQEHIYNGFLEHQAIYATGNMLDFDISDFEIQINDVLQMEDWKKQLKAQKYLFDERIQKRHLQLIKSLC